MTARMRGAATAIVCALVIASVGSSALAQVPREIAIDGTLTDASGANIDGETSITLRLYESGRLLHDEPQMVLVEDGAFSTLLGSERPLPASAFREGSSWELGISVEDDPEMQPRIAIASVPFALESDHATSADRVGALGAEAIQPRLSGACPAGAAISAIDADGVIACTAEVPATVTGACPDGEAISAIAADGAITCAASGPRYEPGPGISIAGARVAVDTTYVQRRVASACPAGQAIRSIGALGDVICESGLTPSVETSRFAERGAAYGASSIALGASTRRMCFLTSVAMSELDVGADVALCRVHLGGDSIWYLESRLGSEGASGGTDAYVGCRAQCLSW
jgi:hypothetical protein